MSIHAEAAYVGQGIYIQYTHTDEVKDHFIKIICNWCGEKTVFFEGQQEHASNLKDNWLPGAITHLMTEHEEVMRP